MEYPFPPDTLVPWNLYCALEVIAIGALFIFSIVPLLRIRFRRVQARHIDDRIALTCGAAAAVIGVTMLLLAPVLPQSSVKFIVVLALMACIINVVWAFTDSDRSTTLLARLTEIGVPYGIGFLALTVALLILTTSPRRSGRPNLECLNNLRNLGLAMHNHASAHNAYLPDLFGPEEVPRSWRVDLLPFLDRSDLYRSYRRDRPWDSVENASHAKSWLRVFSCPNDPNWRQPDSQGRYFTAYAGVRGPNSAFPNGRGASLDDISNADGLGNTLMIVEACGQRIVWTEPRDVDLAKDEIGVNLPGIQPGRSHGVLSSYHTGSTNVVFADGAARPINNNIDPKVLKALLTATGGEPVSQSQFMQ